MFTGAFFLEHFAKMCSVDSFGIMRNFLGFIVKATGTFCNRHADKTGQQLEDMKTHLKYLQENFESAQHEDKRAIEALSAEIKELKKENQKIRAFLHDRCQGKKELKSTSELTAEQQHKQWLGNVAVSKTINVLAGNETREKISIVSGRNERGRSRKVVPPLKSMSPATIPSTKAAQRIQRGASAEPTIVAFHAFLTQRMSNPGDDQTIIFDSTQINVGNFYNHQTGAFTCGVSGVYVFTWVVEINADKHLAAALMQNGSNRGSVSSFGSTTHWSTDSQTVILHVNVGDIIFIQISAGYYDNDAQIGEDVTTFSGFLIG